MNDIGKIIVALLITAYGVWYFFAGFYGWRYPQIRAEWAYKGEHKNLYVQFWKIILGAFMAIAGVAGLIHVIGDMIL